MWHMFDNGATIGRPGSEGGVILRDLEHSQCARVTLERDCFHGIPFAVTCTLYGRFAHTRFVSSEAEAEFPAMVRGLETILKLISHGEDPDSDAKKEQVSKALSDFVARFP